MKHITALLALVVAGTVLAGCEAEVSAGAPAQGRTVAGKGAAASGSAKPGTSAKPGSSATPAEALKGAVQALDATSYNFAIKQGEMTGGGRLDPRAKSATMSMGGDVETISISLSYTIIAPDLWLKADFGDELNKHWGLTPGQWMLLDKSKVPAAGTLPVDASGAPDLGITDLLKTGIGEVERTDATHFSGTVDVTTADSIIAPSEELLKKAGDKAKAVPFTAAVDEKGRLISFKIEGGAIDPDLATELTFTGFGAVQPVTKPEGAIAAPDTVYDLFS